MREVIRQFFSRDPWPHQMNGVLKVVDELKNYNAVTLCSATGAGKSDMMWALTQYYQSQGAKCLILTNRKMLTRQTMENAQAKNIGFGVRAASLAEHFDSSQDIQISSIQTEIARTINTTRWEPFDADYIFVDEGHLQASGESEKFLRSYLHRNRKVVGLSATPIGMSHLYPKLVVSGSPSECLACGSHVRAVIKAPFEFDLSRVGRVKTGEFNVGDIRKYVWSQQIVGRIIDEWRSENPEQRPTLVFAPCVETSIGLVNDFLEAGVKAAHIDAKKVQIGDKSYTDSDGTLRQEIMESWKAGDIKVICNRFVLREGIDLPQMYHLILACPMGSIKTYLQSTGRVIRYSKETPHHVLITDHAGCLDDQTEVLTKDGWKGMGMVNVGDEVAAFDMQSESISWQRANTTHVRGLEPWEKMYAASGPMVDIRVTWNHRMVQKKRGHCSAGPTWSVPYSFMSAEDFSSESGRFKIPISGLQEFPGLDLTDSEIELLGWWITDGSLDKSDMTISQSKHKPCFSRLEECIKECGFDYTFSEYTYDDKPCSKRPGVVWKMNSPSVRYRIPRGTSKSQPKAGWDRISVFLDKDISPLLDAMTARQFEFFLFGIHCGDGDQKKPADKGVYRITKGNKKFIDNLQSMCVRRGYKCNVSVTHEDGFEPKYNANIQRKDSVIVFGRSGVEKNTSLTLSAPKSGGEKVWCVSNDLETLVIRRNGKVCIIGNSYYRFGGGPNRDRNWEEMYYQTSAQIEKKIREQAEKNPSNDPIVCPYCNTARHAGMPSCPAPPFGCGRESGRQGRKIIQSNGQLRLMTGPNFKPPRVRAPSSADQTRWDSLYYRSKNSQSSRAMNFNQLKGAFYRQYGYQPPEGLLRMPKDEATWSRKVRDVPSSSLRSIYDTEQS